MSVPNTVRTLARLSTKSTPPSTQLINLIKILPSALYNKVQSSIFPPPPPEVLPEVPPILPAPNQNAPNFETTNQSALNSQSTNQSSANSNESEIKLANQLPEIKIEAESYLSATSDPTLNWQHLESRTKYLVSVINRNSKLANQHQLLASIESLFTHIYENEGTKDIAVNAGVVKTCSRLLRDYKEKDEVFLCNKIRELMGLLGVNPPVKGKGIRILSLDGGGVRGLVAIEVLRKIEAITGKQTHELFDYICGVSTGSILAFLLGVHRKSLDEAEVLYKELSREIFAQNSWYGAASLLWFHSYYHTGTFENILRKHVGELPLVSQNRVPNVPRVSAISTIVNRERVSPYVFRTYTLPMGVRARHPGGCRYKMWEAVRASAAAPTYFEELKLGKHLHQDGGVMCNNPTSVAVSEARSIWKNDSLECVLSIGTGRSLTSRPEEQDLGEFSPSPNLPPNLSWKGKFLKVLDSATDTESVHHTLNELLPPTIYFRFNPYLTHVPKLDEPNPEKLDKLQEDVREYLKRNVGRVDLCTNVLKQKKSTISKLSNYLSTY